MLDDYREKQYFVYKMIKNSIKKNKCSHAYIIETNGCKDALDFSLSFAKYMFCGHSNEEEKKEECLVCHQIDNNNYVDLKIINPDGMWIKKNQIIDLENEFKNSSLLGNKKIYIINNAHQLNVTAANTMLKFLEEPKSNITAILIVDNIYNLLPTIISRCQVLSLNNEKKQNNYVNIEKNITEEVVENQIENCVNFINYFEINKLETICRTNSLWFKYFKEKEQMILGLTIMLDFYKKVLDYKYNIENGNFIKYEEIIKMISKQTVNVVCSKIETILKAKDKIKNNVNGTLLIDKLIIDLERIK